MKPLTRAVVLLEGFRRYDDGDQIGASQMTGFFWRVDEKLFLITNWHNVTGRNSFLGTYIGSFVPSHFKMTYFGLLGNAESGKMYVRKRDVEISLYEFDDVPVWQEHPAGQDVDVVAIELADALFGEEKPQALNDLNFERRWIPGPGDDCLIVGYPEALSGPIGTPIYKRASIASEPNMYPKSTEPFLIDTLGNQGLSGSPIIARGTGVFLPDGQAEGLTLNSVIGSWEKFIGVYAGRVGDEGIGFQLGRVVHARQIEELFRNRR